MSIFTRIAATLLPRRAAFVCIALCNFTAVSAAFAEGRLLATGGVVELEGSAGGGLTPWALIGGLGTNRQIGGTAYCTEIGPQDFRLNTCGAGIGIDDRVELSFAEQRFDVGSVVPGQTIRQKILGAKVRVFGDIVADQDTLWPQVALGVQWKHNDDFSFIPKAVGASHSSGADFYVAATKLWLDGPFGRSWLADVTLRASEANQLGILGFGGDLGSYHLLPEGSLAMFLNDNLVLGGEYRKKPNNLSAFREQDFKDVFLSFIPVKYASLTLAYLDLGTIAGKSAQHGYYISLQASF